MVRRSARNAAKEPATTTTTTTTTDPHEEAIKTETNGAEADSEELKQRNKRKASASEPKPQSVDSPEADSPEEEESKPEPKKRKTTSSTKLSSQQEQTEMPLAPRTAVNTLRRAMYIGAHVSAAGGVHNSIPNAIHIGANAFALFLKSQRKWTSPPLADDAKNQFHALIKQHGYDATKHVVPHASYLINLAQADAAKAKQAYDCFLDDLKRCEALGIGLYNFHPGSAGPGGDMKAACGRIAAQLNKAIKATKSVVVLLENMCGSGNVVGGRFEELADIISQVEDKSRIGVCLDTCHAFTAGYDLRTPEAFAQTLAEFDRTIGLKYLKALHLNDSKAPYHSNRDLHANIGTGFLGLRAFHNIMNCPTLENLPMVLETPIEEKDAKGKTVENKQIWADEIKLLESLIGMDVESEEFNRLECELQKKGAAERRRIEEQVEKKATKEKKKLDGGKKERGAMDAFVVKKKGEGEA
ncbi:DNA (apurinic or apyrimidinic site) lyase-like protein [Thermochaetoides thermophila DSM 1495]|uniref:Apurinic-apyrimidinic endonuclease 1 n=1 Tax=Chaetomium thermophilum (strain DSM 1495 / CBS 144.50 / IMI 039719) TaxID=759272 RepID=G0SGR4_CHATD|nr:DNA (apurinic or apyrimidinic site) lyase-like protein [Thermochaetoides thermophila DSM 1495]EGS17403.1 DNA (apurinic or apyrimidinic site) lyase-like protein [Thermochaetoides thermophila DSM 1495]